MKYQAQTVEVHGLPASLTAENRLIVSAALTAKSKRMAADALVPDEAINTPRTPNLTMLLRSADLRLASEVYCENVEARVIGCFDAFAGILRIQHTLSHLLNSLPPYWRILVAVARSEVELGEQWSIDCSPGNPVRWSSRAGGRVGVLVEGGHLYVHALPSAARDGGGVTVVKTQDELDSEVDGALTILHAHLSAALPPDALSVVLGAPPFKNRNEEAQSRAQAAFAAMARTTQV